VQDYHYTVDVVVIGGGTAGVIAALQAARAGVRTAIVPPDLDESGASHK